MNAVEKIIAAHSSSPVVRAGQIVDVDPDYVMANDATTSHTIDIFKQKLQATRVCNPEKIVLVMDHYTPSSSADAADNHNKMRAFAQEQGISNVYDGSGICHQLMMEHHVRPGHLIIGADSHTCTYGALGALSTGMGSTDISVAWKEGKTWMKVPEAYRITISGQWSPYVQAKDLALKIIADLTAKGATYKALCFSGPAISALDLSGRMTLANMAIEAGAKFAYIKPDEKVAAYLRQRGRSNYPLIEDDRNSVYEKEFSYCVSELSPQVAAPHSVDNVMDINEVEGTPINELFLGACTNGRYEDLETAAGILQGKKIARTVRLLVTPASTEVYLEAMNSGIIRTLMESGAMINHPGCSACFGGTGGILGTGERLLTTANRNFRGRVGKADSEIYLASPAVVAASAITGSITDPRRTDA